MHQRTSLRRLQDHASQQPQHQVVGNWKHRDLQQCYAFDADDSVVSLTPQQIQDKLTTDSAVPRGFQVALVDSMLIIYRLQLVDCLPEVQASVTRSDLTINNNNNNNNNNKNECHSNIIVDKLQGCR